MSIYGVIYKITNKINGKVYIGQTRKLVRERWYSHCEAAKYKTSPSKLHADIRLFKPPAFSIETIAWASNQDELDQREIELIIEYEAIKNGYNTARGGQHYPEISNTASKARELARDGYNMSEISKMIGVQEETVLHAIQEYQIDVGCDFYRVEYGSPQDSSDPFGDESDADDVCANETDRYYQRTCDENGNLIPKWVRDAIKKG